VRLRRLFVLSNSANVMPALVAGIHVFAVKQDVDGRDKPGHDRC
jgi:hypothetical protein